MKDVMTILVCNAIRASDHLRNVKGVDILCDEDVVGIAARVQADYHKTELMRFINTQPKALSGMAGPTAAGSVTHPDDLLSAAKEGLGELFDEFIEIHGADFTAFQLAQFSDRKRSVE